MSEANQLTVEAYDKAAETYAAEAELVTPEPQQQWMNRVFNGIPKSASVLEIGSAIGREARYLMERGYVVDTSDASEAFVKYLRDQGFDARQLDIIHETPDKIYDVIVAFAVFVHFDLEDMERALSHIAKSLSPNGVLAFSVIQGDGDKWSSHRLNVSRYFKYWQPEELNDIAEQAGLRLSDSQKDSYGGKEWLQRVYKHKGPDR